MRTCYWISTGLLFAICSLVSASGQSISSRPLKPEQPAVELPKGSSAWALHIVRYGGLTSGTGNDITITSEGKLTCGPPDNSCASRVVSDLLKTLSPEVLSTKLSGKGKGGEALDYACSDCSVTVITLRRREADGKTRTYSAFWDPITAVNAPEDLLRIAGIVLPHPVQ